LREKVTNEQEDDDYIADLKRKLKAKSKEGRDDEDYIADLKRELKAEVKMRKEDGDYIAELERKLEDREPQYPNDNYTIKTLQEENKALNEKLEKVKKAGQSVWFSCGFDKQ
jgi:hypothetical protein